MGKTGKCKLTGNVGPFVRSHILPRAFVDKNLDKTLRIEFGQDGRRPGIRGTGWYDDELVTRAGEDILERYDSDAAKIIRQHGLCWRWFPTKELAERTKLDDEWGMEYIKIPNVDTKALRLFFLSLLWRSVATRRPQFREIRIDFLAREKLRKIVEGRIEGSPSDFPVVLILLTTKGQPQNITPLRQTIKMTKMFDGAYPDIPIFRFFLDGLVAHVGRKPLDRRLLDSWHRRVLGTSSDLFVIGRKYEGSFQDQNLLYLQNELDATWPDEARKIYGALEKNG
ncbi:hypothetical protein FJ417_28740 [Mesorhizobium sp. B3-1-7]|uniref:hypothetical protein n=1 Tax=Mesorhizobium sp. B3-1-7 TaxID=2589894 RepID=UPI001129827F|nr:hypothetical protein [Mesorhizobium sp. B3-1-7]TPI51153.1 hypothetical protein FJ417_28740 [Mesorhizobium sp. B3-1-7]